MRKVVLIALAAFSPFLIAAWFIVPLFRLSTQQLIDKLTSGQLTPTQHFFYWASIMNFGGLRRPDTGELPPIHYLIHHCYGEKRPRGECDGLLMFLIKSGYDINELSNDNRRVTPLHEAVLICDQVLVFWLVGQKADTHRVAGAGPYQGETAQALLNHMTPSCPKQEMMSFNLQQVGAN